MTAATFNGSVNISDSASGLASWLPMTWWNTSKAPLYFTTAVIFWTSSGGESTKTITTNTGAYGSFVTACIGNAGSYSLSNWQTGAASPPTPTQTVAQTSGPRDMLVVEFFGRLSPTFIRTDWTEPNGYTYDGRAIGGACNKTLTNPTKFTSNTAMSHRTVSAATTTYTGTSTQTTLKNNYTVYDGQWAAQGWGATGFNKICNPNALATSMHVSFFV